MKIHDIMSPTARCVGLDNSLVEAAGVMRLFNLGAVAVCEDDRVIGMLTDHDIVIRGVANGGDLNRLRVREAISDGVVSIFEDDDIEDAATAMVREHVARLPVLDHDQHLVGMISRDDVF